MGHLETDVMDILWARGESSVHEVAAQLPRPLAYTTVMTTLARRKAERAFVYVPRMSRADLLLSFLVDSAGGEDPALLDELERRIRQKRRELDRRRKTS
jgi:predicted transcriptional regulator